MPIGSDSLGNSRVTKTLDIAQTSAHHTPDAEALRTDLLCIGNLLNDFGAVAELLRGELRALSGDAPAHMAAHDTSGKSACRSMPPPNRTGHVLDAFLLAAGLSQMLDDYLHRDVFSLRKVAKQLRRLPSPAGRIASMGAHLTGSALYQARSSLAPTPALRAGRRDLDELLRSLADAVAATVATGASSAPDGAWGSSAHDLDQMRTRGLRLEESLRRVPLALTREVLRLPSAFRSFDQRPEDCWRLAQSFADRHPDHDQPLTVVGVRTSGSYLAPLCAAFLRTLGYRDVVATTLRPGQRWLPHEVDGLLACVRAGGRILLVDDPPATGKAIDSAARSLTSIGIERQAITLLLAIFGTCDDVPAVLQTYEAVTLPWNEWAIHEQLAPAAVQRALSELLCDHRITCRDALNASHEVQVAAVDAVEHIPLSQSPQTHDLVAMPQTRGHVRARYRLQCVEQGTNARWSAEVYAKGIGLGYLGRHALAVALPLADFVAPVLGERDGVLWRIWLPEERRLTVAPEDVRRANLARVSERIATYVAARRQELPSADVTPRLTGRHPVWQRGSDILSGAFGRAAPLARPMLHRAARQMLLANIERPSVVDSSMAPAQWFAPEPPEENWRVRKVDFDERAFSNFDMYCYDAFFDLAGAAAYFQLGGCGDASFARSLRDHFEALTGQTCSDERWLLYQLVALWGDARQLSDVLGTLRQPSMPSPATLAPATSAARSVDAAVESTMAAMLDVLRMLSRLLGRYLGERSCADITVQVRGPLCGIDIDGVLETEWLGFTATTPAGTQALRSLACHGYTPVLVTGRSLDEVVERCAAFHLAGGVAEYGAVAYDHVTGRTSVLLSENEQATLAAVRHALRQLPGVWLDESYRHAVRAFRLTQDGRRGLTSEMIETVVRSIAVEGQVRPIPGAYQTDFMVVGIDKATGLRALVDLLQAPVPAVAPAALLAFAVGDSVSDAPMLRLAAHPFAPANADAGLQALARSGECHVDIMTRPYQAGLLQAVSRFLDHSPAACVTCRVPHHSGDARLVLTALAAQDTGKWGKLIQAVLLALHTAHMRHRRAPQANGSAR